MMRHAQVDHEAAGERQEDDLAVGDRRHQELDDARRQDEAEDSAEEHDQDADGDAATQLGEVVDERHGGRLGAGVDSTSPTSPRAG